MVRIDKQYFFERPGGRADLSELFQGRRRLIVYQFPFDPAWDGDCGRSSHLADRLAGGIAHLPARDTSFAAVSWAPVERIEACQERLRWTFPWLSSFPSAFSEDFPEGLSVFVRDGADVFHTYSTFEHRLDAFLGTYESVDVPLLRRSDRFPPQQARR